MTWRPSIGQLIATYSVPRILADALVENGYVLPERQNDLLEILYAHDRAHQVVVVVCHCGAKVFDIAAHQEECLMRSGLVTGLDLP